MKKKIAIIATAIASALVLSGCLGDSNKTSDTFVCIKAVYKYNTGEISQNKWVNEILFIIPGGLCYFVGSILDVIIFNSIQFWSGSNPIAETTITDADGTEYLLAKQADGSVKATNLTTGEAIELRYNADEKVCNIVGA
ncbi:MAG: DUF3332 family protein [Candidatus Spyradosoma sp.]